MDSDEPGDKMAGWGLVTAVAGVLVIILAMVTPGDSGGTQFGWLLVLSGLLIRIEAALQRLASRTGSGGR
jgi:hypothetical protein